MNETPRLRTPEEVAEHLGHLTAYEIRRLARRSEIEHVRGSRGKVLLTDSQVQALIEHLTRKPAKPEPRRQDSTLRMTSRSRALHRRNAPKDG
ncbi:hypothetical protein GCM10027403_13060 [Arthrobacter tecti]